MPCRGPEPWKEALQQKKDRIEKYGIDIADVHILTRGLCEAAKKLENANIAMSPELKEWWEAHKLFDKDRRKKEIIDKKEKKLRAEKQRERELKELKRLAKELGIEINEKKS